MTGGAGPLNILRVWENVFNCYGQTNDFIGAIVTTYKCTQHNYWGVNFYFLTDSRHHKTKLKGFDNKVRSYSQDTSYQVILTHKYKLGRKFHTLTPFMFVSHWAFHSFNTNITWAALSCEQWVRMTNRIPKNIIQAMTLNIACLCVFHLVWWIHAKKRTIGFFASHPKSEAY